MKPDESFVKSGLPAKGRVRVLSEAGRQYAVQLFGGPSAKLSLELPAGKYKAEWIKPATGDVLNTAVLSTAEKMPFELVSPNYDPDTALRIKRIDEKQLARRGHLKVQ